jgi:hypothetical protein
MLSNFNKSSDYAKWLLYDKPSDESNLVQITANDSFIFTMNKKGDVYIREFLFNDSLDNQKWIKVLKDLSSISVSLSNQVKILLASN